MGFLIGGQKTAYLKRRTHVFLRECGVAIRFTFPRSVH